MTVTVAQEGWTLLGAADRRLSRGPQQKGRALLSPRFSGTFAHVARNHLQSRGGGFMLKEDRENASSHRVV